LHTLALIKEWWGKPHPAIYRPIYDSISIKSVRRQIYFLRLWEPFNLEFLRNIRGIIQAESNQISVCATAL